MGVWFPSPTLPPCHRCCQFSDIAARFCHERGPSPLAQGDIKNVVLTLPDQRLDRNEKLGYTDVYSWRKANV